MVKKLSVWKNLSIIKQLSIIEEIVMHSHTEFQKMQLNEIQVLYEKLNQEKKSEVSLTETVITWLTEGYAEEFRRKYLKSIML
jgi:hypothetical protein